jgi:leader peptidase (prepilin peptidase)/N-methyltransferase
MWEAISLVIIVLFGLCIGSFLNVCIYRLPRQASLFWPPSHCPKCLSTLKVWENIPLLSYLILRGRCSWCNAQISVHYPVVEAMTAALSVLLWQKFGLTPKFFLYLSFFSAMIANSFIDLEHYLLMDALIIPWLFLGIICSLIGVLPIGGVSSILGALIGAGSLSILVFLSPLIFKKEGMGIGDVKLAASAGAFLGWKGVVLALLFSFILGAGAGLLLVGLGKKRAKDYIPFGPCLCVGCFLSFLFADSIISWYLEYIK